MLACDRSTDHSLIAFAAQIPHLYFVHVDKALEVHIRYQTQWMAVGAGFDTNRTLSTAGIVMRVRESLKIPIVPDRSSMDLWRGGVTTYVPWYDPVKVRSSVDCHKFRELPVRSIYPNN